MTLSVFDRLGALGVVPIVVIEDVGHAAPLGHALVAGGLACAEVTPGWILPRPRRNEAPRLLRSSAWAGSSRPMVVRGM